MSTVSGVREWGRICQVVIGKEGKGIQVSGNDPGKSLRVHFEVTKTIEPTPNSATIQIYNLNPDHANAIQKEYTDVLLKAGYVGNVAMIFTGNIQFVSHYRKETDWITEITAGDGDRDFRNAHIHTTLVAGSTDLDAVKRIVDAMPDTNPGEIQVSTKPRLRGKTMSGTCRDALDQIAAANGCSWSIQDGELQIVPGDAMIKTNEAIVINAETGMIEAPERNDKGIGVKCLLNPAIKLNCPIKLDNNQIRLKQQKPRILGQTKTEKKPPVHLDPDGIYKVIKLVHQGDNRANDWFTLVECIGLDQPVPTSSTATDSEGVPAEGADFEGM